LASVLLLLLLRQGQCIGLIVIIRSLHPARRSPEEFRRLPGKPRSAIELIRSPVQVCQRVGKDSIFFFSRAFRIDLLYSVDSAADLDGRLNVVGKIGYDTVLDRSPREPAFVLNNHLGQLKN